MERGKRASMREGPLAALFRKTEEEGVGEHGATPEGHPQDRRHERAEFGQVPGSGEIAEPPEPRVGQARTSGSHEHLAEDDSRLEQLRPAPPSARTRRPGPEPEPRSERRVRSPEERLRDVFSTDIPENIMELSPAREPEQPRFGREEPAMPTSTVDKVLQPVLRVVGVGGAGVNAVNRMIEAGVEGVDFNALNTDLQSLQQSSADVTLHIGAEATHGLG